jgi:citrate lyase subunit beta/citryl-CoA lyase
VPAERKPHARELAHALLQSPRSGYPPLWARINGLRTRDSRLDVSSLVAAGPCGLVVPKVDHPSELAELSDTLSEIEDGAGVTVGTTRLIALLESPRAILTAHAYLEVRLERLSGISWGGEDLAAALGARLVRDAEGGWSDALRCARVQCLMVARAIGVDPIDTITADFKNLDSLRAESLRSRAAGFNAKLAIHPAQVGAINDAFQPSAAELDHARRVIAAFAEAPGLGVVALDGVMIDIVHLHAARRVLEGKHGV